MDFYQTLIKLSEQQEPEELDEFKNTVGKIIAGTALAGMALGATANKANAYENPEKAKIIQQIKQEKYKYTQGIKITTTDGKMSKIFKYNPKDYKSFEEADQKAEAFKIELKKQGKKYKEETLDNSSEKAFSDYEKTHKASNNF